MEYTKPPLPIPDQIALLESRGLSVPDHDKAAKYLSNISYYRLSAYLYPFKIQDPATNEVTNKFKPGTTFDDVIDLYVFDRKLRLFVFDEIERIEVAFRTQIIYHPSLEKGAHWFEDRANYENPPMVDICLSEIDSEINRSKEVFILHYFDKYTNPKRPPAWMVFEAVSFGVISKIYENMHESSNSKKNIALHFGIPKPFIFESWLQSITYVRNICAHHSRLWNRILTKKPKFLKSPKKIWITQPEPKNDSVYYFLCCLLYLLREIIPRTGFVKRLKGLLAKHPNIPIQAMGFPDKWEDEDFWK